MHIFKLTTNERVEYVRSTNERLRKAMYAYIREKRAQDMPLAAITFTWHPIYPSRTI